MFSSKCRGGHSSPTDCPPERPSVRTTGTHTCYNQLQKYLRHCTVFWQKWPVHDLLLVIPPPPLIKVASNTRPYSKRGGTTLNGREEGGQYYILQTFDQERFEARKAVFPWECLIIFATSCSYVLWEPTDCTSMLWSVDWQNKVSAAQYHLTVSRAEVSTHLGRVVFEGIRWQVTIFQMIAGSFFWTHMKYVVFMSLWPSTMNILISNWVRTLKFSQLLKNASSENRWFSLFSP